ncbi:MAG TPA: hypothetical protein VGU63_08230 [Candidatus Acidoferrales bacterium]|nr:hypothetical protein [Candidatus Acidoferrales bacterium]
MKVGMRTGVILMCLAMIPLCVQAQEKAKSPDQEITSHLRLDFLLTEYNGQQKVSSMPYTMYVEASSHGGRPGRLRMGLKAPVSEANGVPNTVITPQFAYMDLGTNIDCQAWVQEDHAYDLQLSVNRSSAYSAGETLPSAGGRPVTRNFITDFNLKMHDGETAEGPSAADPFNGHVLKISVTLHVIK